MAAITATPYVKEQVIEERNYSNYSMVIRGLCIDNPRVASKYIAEYEKVLLEYKTTVSIKDPLIKRLNNAGLSAVQLAKIMGSLVADEKDGVTVAGEILTALGHLNQWKTHSVLDNMMKTDKVSTEKVISYMKAKGYNPPLWLKY
jgi:hypothetical protein